MINEVYNQIYLSYLSLELYRMVYQCDQWMTKHRISQQIYCLYPFKTVLQLVRIVAYKILLNYILCRDNSVHVAHFRPEKI